MKVMDAPETGAARSEILQICERMEALLPEVERLNEIADGAPNAAKDKMTRRSIHPSLWTENDADADWTDLTLRRLLEDVAAGGR